MLLARSRWRCYLRALLLPAKSAKFSGLLADLKECSAEGRVELYAHTDADGMEGKAWSAAKPRPPVDLNDREWEDDARAIRRIARALDAGPDRPAAADQEATDQRTGLAATAGEFRPRRPRARSTWLAWFFLSVGLLTFVFGGTLLAWAVTGNGTDLWSWGLPLTLAGQCVLLIGGVLFVDSLWQDHCATSEVLDTVNEQLAQLRHATSLLGSAYGLSDRSFYAHLADGASPQMLLADVKGQLDMLALKLGRER
jgi:hypothetical protein